jgi:hypothetical protein
MRRRKPPTEEAKLIEDAESVAIFESTIRAIKERYSDSRERFRMFMEVVAEARRLPKNRCVGDSRPLVRVQACRPEDRAMLETPAGAELVSAVRDKISAETATVEELRAAGLWPFPENPVVCSFEDRLGPEKHRRKTG